MPATDLFCMRHLDVKTCLLRPSTHRRHFSSLHHSRLWFVGTNTGLPREACNHHGLCSADSNQLNSTKQLHRQLPPPLPPDLPPLFLSPIHSSTLPLIHPSSHPSISSSCTACPSTQLASFG
ncbi:unnamed protein product [Protopolystoma xenopodis]|uniref:Uncharacterized protein n=1 Tax=Protopolystoma xenopodis TaxID=117903 RepID=A0A448XIK0_9PLAT|nr:unnamed protein product [Protopolystoma xenopodis]